MTSNILTDIILPCIVYSIVGLMIGTFTIASIREFIRSSKKQRADADEKDLVEALKRCNLASPNKCKGCPYHRAEGGCLNKMSEVTLNLIDAKNIRIGELQLKIDKLERKLDKATRGENSG